MLRYLFLLSLDPTGGRIATFRARRSFDQRPNSICHAVAPVANDTDIGSSFT